MNKTFFIVRCLAFLLYIRRCVTLTLFRTLVWITSRCKKKNEFALIIRTDYFGDAVISTSAFKYYRDFFQSKGIAVVLVCNYVMESFFRNCPYFDSIFTVNLRHFDSSFFYRLKICRQLAKYNPQYSINMSSIFGSGSISAILTIASCAKMTCGIIPQPPLDIKMNDGLDVCIPSRKWSCFEYFLRRPFTKREILYLSYQCTYRPLRHAYKLVVQGNAIGQAQEEEFRLLRMVTKDDSYHPENIPPSWLDCNCSSHKKLPLNCYLIVPGASNPERTYSEHNFAMLIDLIHEHFPMLEACICGVEKERPIAEKIISEVHSGAIVHNICGTTSWEELYSTVHDVIFVIANDTGTAHLAASLGKLTFIILGYGQFDGRNGFYFPTSTYSRVHIVSLIPPPSCSVCTWLCHRKIENRFACISMLHPQDAWKQILPILTREIQ